MYLITKARFNIAHCMELQVKNHKVLKQRRKRVLQA